MKTDKDQRHFLLPVSESEADLIEAIRNYIRSYPNGYPERLDYYLMFYPTLFKTGAMEIVMKRNDRAQITDVKKRLSAIYMKITWREIALDYFGKSPSWLYHKLDGIDGNGGKGGFTQDELFTLKGALLDLSNKIKKAAEEL